MTDQHPISVPQELLNQWCRWKPEQTPEGLWRKIADNAAQWSADAELEKCCEWAKQFNYDDECYEDKLREARRPPAPIKADQALAALGRSPKAGEPTITVDVEQYDIILCALQRLKELEGLAND
jgi:hypothetical protein